jgi:predicted RNase H-like HicB family nuclease
MIDSEESIVSLKEGCSFKVLLQHDVTTGYVIICPSLPGCYTQGETVEEVMANIEEAILLCLEDMQAMETR